MVVVWRVFLGHVGGEDTQFVEPLQFKSRRDMLQEYVKNVQPEFMERFVQKAPTQVGYSCPVVFPGRSGYLALNLMRFNGCFLFGCP